MKTSTFIVAAIALTSFRSALTDAQQQPAPPQLPQAPNMTFFVTSVGLGKGADLGGIEGADKHCQSWRTRHGAGGKTWHAYLSTQEAAGKPPSMPATGSARVPGRTSRATVVATSVDDLHGDNNKLGMENSLTERGNNIPGVGYSPNYHDALTGSTADGKAFPAS